MVGAGAGLLAWLGFETTVSPALGLKQRRWPRTSSMAMCTSAFAWALTRPAVAPVYRVALMPAMGVFGLMLGLYVRLT